MLNIIKKIRRGLGASARCERQLERLIGEVDSLRRHLSFQSGYRLDSFMIDGISMYLKNSPLSFMGSQNPMLEYDFSKIDFKDGDVVVDIGANTGAEAIFLALRHPNLRIHSFEPSPEAFSLLKENIRINGLENHGNLVVENLAITADGRDVEIVTPRTYSAGSYLKGLDNNVESLASGKAATANIAGAEHHRYASTNIELTTRIPSINLERYLQAKQISKVKLLKIDCEGAEYEIFDAMKDFSKFEYLIGEIHSYNREQDGIELFGRLCRHFPREKMHFVNYGIIGDRFGANFLGEL